MAQVIKRERKVELRGSPEKLYDFWKHHITTVTQLFPNHIKEVQICEGGTHLRAGCTIFEKYSLDGRTTLTAKLKVQSIDDARKSMTFQMVEGELLRQYRTFKDKFEMGPNYVKWYVEVEKSSRDAPDPEIFLDWLAMVTKGLDSHLLSRQVM